MLSSLEALGENSAVPFLSGDFKASLTVHHVFVDPHGVPGFQMTQSAVTHLTFKAGGMAVNLHFIQDHLGITSEWFTTGGAQVFVKDHPLSTLEGGSIERIWLIRPAAGPV